MRRLTPLALLFCALSYDVCAQNEKPLINSGALISEAIKLHDQGKFKDALAAYRQISRNDTNYVYALYEAALSLHADSQFLESVRFCEEALKEKGEREREPDLYTQLAISLDHSGNKDRSLKVFDSGLAKYPAHIPLLFNKAVTLTRSERIDEAVKTLQQALLINPYHASSHYRLGHLAIQQGRPVEGFMSLTTYLIMTPAGPNSLQAISVLNNIALGNEEILKHIRSRKVTPPENLLDVENIVISKIALNKSYKPLLKLDDAISRQLQVICEKVVYDKDEKDFWMQYYVPLFTAMLQEKRFEPFVNYIFSNVNIESIQKYNKSHKKEVAGLTEDVVAYAQDIKTTRELNYEKRKTANLRFVFGDSNFGSGATAENGTITVNSWQYYFNAGNPQATGEYNSKGEKTGYWKYYHYNGRLKGTEYVKDGKAEGVSIDYFENGNMSDSGTYRNGKKEGQYKTYFYTGALNRILEYKDDELDGNVKRFYANGGLREEQQYKAGKQHGNYIEYHPNGKKQVLVNFVNDVEEGVTTGFYGNGNKMFEGQYVAGKHSGEWKRYYKNGNLQSVEHYDKGEFDGEYISYHDNGQLHFKTNYKQGLANGEITYISREGKPYSVYVFDKNNAKSARFLDQSGKEIGKSALQSKNMHLVTYNSEGQKETEKDVNENGEVNGIQTDYYPNGAVKTKSELVNSVVNGKATGYFLNGEKHYETVYTDGERNGYYRELHQNGKIAAEGWFKDDLKYGDWYYYDKLGKLITKEHLMHGEPHGINQEYYPGGALKIETKYHYGWLIGNTQYDTLGKIIAHNELSTGSGPFTMNYFDGKKQMHGKQVNGNFQGPKNVYYPNGAINISQEFLNDKMHGEVKVYHPNGQLQTIGVFDYGEKQGLWKFFTSKGKLSSTAEYLDDELNGKTVSFYQNGKVEEETNYANGLRQGIKKRYDSIGELVYQIRYKNDLPVGYSYADKSGNPVPEIPIVGGTGKVATFYKNGKPSATFEYVAGKLNGKDLLYHSNGQLWVESSDQFGETHGPLTSYHPNGKVNHKTSYLNGNEHGSYKYFNSEGRLIEEGYHHNGELHGERKLFDEKGKLTVSYKYYYGTLVSIN